MFETIDTTKEMLYIAVPVVSAAAVLAITAWDSILKYRTNTALAEELQKAINSELGSANTSKLLCWYEDARTLASVTFIRKDARKICEQLVMDLEEKLLPIAQDQILGELGMLRPSRLEHIDPEKLSPVYRVLKSGNCDSL